MKQKLRRKRGRDLDSRLLGKKLGKRKATRVEKTLSIYSSGK